MTGASSPRREDGPARRRRAGGRIVQAFHGLRPTSADPRFEAEFAAELRERLDPESLMAIMARHACGTGYFDVAVRRICLRALMRSVGSGVSVAPTVRFVHPETIDVGDRVFIGEYAVIQGRLGGGCIIGEGSWIGPQAFLDGRDLVIGSRVGWGPGAKVLGSEHTGVPGDVPIIQTDLVVSPVRIGDWADIGTNAVIMPGVTVGRGAIVGAGAVVTTDVPDFSIVAGIPARVIGHRSPSDAPFDASMPLA